MTNEEVLKRIKGGLIVSCQALSTEPLCDPYIMSMMAYAAKEGGAVGIRANTTVDIEAIKKKGGFAYYRNNKKKTMREATSI